jgi:RNAse (barnase) inhibitor barstar
LAAIDVLNVDVDIPIEVVFKKRVDARMLKDEVLE